MEPFVGRDPEVNRERGCQHYAPGRDQPSPYLAFNVEKLETLPCAECAQ